MKEDERLKNIPQEGFIKLGVQKKEFKNREEKVALIRKGNDLFNKKEYDLAKRIFLTTGYSDGLMRLGELYMKEKNPLEAFRMYWVAPDKKKVDAMIEKMAKMISRWLKSDGDK